MDFGLSSEQRMLIDTVRRFITSELRPLEEEVELDGALAPEKARDILEKSKTLGLYAMNIAEDFGGGGLSTLDWMLAEEQFGHTTDILVRRAFGNIYEILLAGDEAQRERWLLPSVRGERTFSVAFTEPEAGSDAAGIRTRAIRTNDGWLLNGYKHFISDGLFSDFFVVTAVTNPDAGKHGISTFIVDKAMEGVSIGRDQPMMGLRGTSHVELFFDQVHLKQEHLLGAEGKGLKLALETLGRIRLAQIGARSIGKATRILDLSLAHAGERKQFGKSIGDFQMIQQMLADSAVEINAARLALHRTAWEIDQGLDARNQISVVKVQASETLNRVADRAVQIFGGMGYCKDLPIERYYRDARIYRIYDGTSEIHRSVIARALMKGDTSLYQMTT
ncbi:acyl-CoA dehydrogenase family protein [Pelagibius sp. Alg239-R121]|uniref:acyl-CoA dehydrogenase family protein n=1 Tax=Pelagibius sp. Alg239-R121 TaxID=2993448 RepID=UPI0024A766DF|nr:acyl-CoA dehydrogenase family protein [Pelagibius sp. Alg239-R121]